MKKEKGQIKGLIKDLLASELGKSGYFVDQEIDPKWNLQSEPFPICG